MFRFYLPWFALLLPLPYLIRRFFPSKKNNQHPEIRFPQIDRLKEAFPTYDGSQGTTQNLFLALLSLVWVLLILTLMQPENVDQYTQINHQGYDLMLAVDLSPSMQALDFSTTFTTKSRLDVTKEVVSDFVLKRQGDRVGLIGFGQNAYLHVPLTLDTLSASHLLNDLAAGMAGQATAIGDAIGLSVRTLRERPEGSRVLILLTDGEDNASTIPPLEAAKLAKQYGIRIYTIGVGKNGPVPYPTSLGGSRMVHMSIDEDLLKEIASLTEGEYFRATDPKALEEIYNKIDQLEKSESKEKEYLIREPLYIYPLSLALILLFILTMVPVFRRAINGY